MSRVLVTGANGFVATELIKQLCNEGYEVVGTVRPATAENKLADLLSLVHGSKGSLRLVHVDLLQPGGFDEAIIGCEFVFHVASPFVIGVADPQRDLVTPALEGTRNVFGSVAKHKEHVKKVVVTSSVAAVHDMRQTVPPKNGSLYTEEDWNEASTLEAEGYWVSKVLAEKEALKLGAEIGVPVVTICPNFVLGPPSTATAIGTSVGFMKGLLESQPGDPARSGAWTLVDVRDVATAHIRAITTPEAAGRIILSHRAPVGARFVTDVIKARLPGFAIPDGEATTCRESIDNSKASTLLHVNLRPVEETIGDMAEALVKLGIVKSP